MGPILSRGGEPDRNLQRCVRKRRYDRPLEEAGGSRPSTSTAQSRSAVSSGRRQLPRSYSVLIGIIVPLAAEVFGKVTVSSPFLNAAVTLLGSTATGSRILRRNSP